MSGRTSGATSPVMNLGRVLLASLVLVGACERTSPPSAVTTGSSSATARALHDAPQPDRGMGSAGSVSTEVESAMTAFLVYSESVYVIMREHGKDCDEAARYLASRAPVFLELAPRMMKLKVDLEGLPEQERSRILRASDQAMEAFKERNSDLVAIDQMARACEKTSPAFAKIVKK